MTFGTGFIPDRLPDVLGRAASALRRREVLAGVGSLPDEYEIGQQRYAGQNGFEACVQFGAVQCLHLWRAARGLPDPVHSPWHLYAWTRRMQWWPVPRKLVDEGSSPGVMTRAARTHGIGYFEDWNPRTEGFDINSLPPTLANIEAQRWSLDIPAIWDDGDKLPDRIADSVCKDMPAMIALAIDAGFKRMTQPEVIGPPTGPIVGNHLVAISGTRKRADGRRDTKIINSWRRDWNSDGTAWLSPDYVAKARWVGYLRNVTRPAA